MAWPESATSEREMWAEAEVAKKKDDTEVEYVSKWREQSKKTKKTRLKTRRKWVHNERLLFFFSAADDDDAIVKTQTEFIISSRLPIHRSEYICCFSLSLLLSPKVDDASNIHYPALHLYVVVVVVSSLFFHLLLAQQFLCSWRILVYIYTWNIHDLLSERRPNISHPEHAKI